MLYKAGLLLWEKNQFLKLTFAIFLSIIMNLSNKFSFCLLVSDFGNYYVRIFYASTFAINIFFQKLYDKYIYHLEALLENKSDYYQKYNNLEYLSQQQIGIRDFRRKVDDSIMAITIVLSWGISTTFDTLCNLITVVWLFYTNGFFYILICIVIVNAAFYWYNTRHAQIIFNKFVSETKTQNDRDYSKINILLDLIDVESNFSGQVVEKEVAITCRRVIQRIKWDNIQKHIKILNIIPIAAIVLGFECDMEASILLVTNCYQFITTYEHMLMFLQRYVDYRLQYDQYEKMWDGMKFTQQVEQLDVPKIINIEKVDIKVDNFHINGSDFKFSKNSNILVVGESGGGKTTFTLSLIGKIPGVYLDENSPQNYTSKSIKFSQDVSGSISCGKITLRDLFISSQNDDLVIKCLDVCNILVWARGLSDDKFLDTNIDNRISGGEKSRLVLALTVYCAKVYNKQIVIFDEPEKGLNPALAYDTISKIIAELQDKMVVVVSHLEKIRGTIEWDHVLLAENSTIVEI